MPELRIQQYFMDSADACGQWADQLAEPVAAAAQAVLDCVANGGKVLACGSGAAAALAPYAAAVLMGGLARPRPALPALALGADAATLAALARPGDELEALAAQVRALGQPGDALLVFAHPGHVGDAGLILAVQAAHEREMSVIVLTGNDDAAEGFASLLQAPDVHVAVSDAGVAQALGAYLLALHGLCDALDAMLLGDEE